MTAICRSSSILQSSRAAELIIKNSLDQSIASAKDDVPRSFRTIFNRIGVPAPQIVLVWVPYGDKNETRCRGFCFLNEPSRCMRHDGPELTGV
jgi:hypothetical protein